MCVIQLKYAHVHRTREIRACDQFLALLPMDFEPRDLRPRIAKCVKPERREDRGHYLGCKMYGRCLGDVRKALRFSIVCLEIITALAFQTADACRRRAKLTFMHRCCGTPFCCINIMYMRNASSPRVPPNMRFWQFQSGFVGVH